MLDHFRDYTDVVGDNHVNLGATTLGRDGLRADRRAKYRDWMLEYVDAWVERTEQNGGLIPSSVGLGRHDRERLRLVRRRLRLGLLGDADALRNGKLAHRAYHTPHAVRASRTRCCSPATARYVDVWRRMIDMVNANAKQEDGQTLYPHMYGRLDRLERLQQGGVAGRPASDGPDGLVRVPAGEVRAERRGALLLDARPLGAGADAARRRAGCATSTARTPATRRPRSQPTSRRCDRKVAADAGGPPLAGHARCPTT